MRDILFLVLIVLLAGLALLFGSLIVGLGALAVGWVLGRVFSLGLYESTIVALGSGALLIWLVTRVLQMFLLSSIEEEEEEPDEYELLSRRVGRDRRKRSKR